MDSSQISSIISSTINEMFYKIFSSIDNSLYDVLDDFTFISTDILNDKYFSNILGSSSTSGILLIANALVFGYLIYYSFKLILSYLGITQVESPTVFTLKLIIYSICMNFSLFICEEIISLISIISASIRQVGENLYNNQICFSELINKLNSVISINENLEIFSLDGIIKSIISVGLLNLVITYAVRYVLIKVFVFLSPFAILSLCNKSTSILFKSWFKSFISLMLVQVFVAIILLLIFSLDFKSNNIYSKFILIGAFFILIKANTYVREMLGGIGTDVNMGINNFKSMMIKWKEFLNEIYLP